MFNTFNLATYLSPFNFPVFVLFMLNALLYFGTSSHTIQISPLRYHIDTEPVLDVGPCEAPLHTVHTLSPLPKSL